MPTFRVASARTEQAVLHIEAEDEWAAERAARRIRQPSDWTSVGAIDAWAVEVSERRVPNDDVVWAADGPTWRGNPTGDEGTPNGDEIGADDDHRPPIARLPAAAIHDARRLPGLAPGP